MKRMGLVFLSCCIVLALLAPRAMAGETLERGDYEYVIINGEAKITDYFGEETDVVLPDTIEGVPIVMLQSLSKRKNDTIRSVVIPEGITILDSFAFDNCEALSSVTLPASLTDIDADAFGWTMLTDITLDEANEVYALRDGVLYETAGNILRAYPGGRGDTSFEVPEGTLGIGPYAFYGSALETVILPQSLEEIADYAFAEMKNLHTFPVPDNMGEFSTHAFVGSAVEAFEVSDGATYYSAIDGVLYSKDGTILLKYPPAKPGDTYVFPDGTTRIWHYAFARIKQLQELHLLEGITEVGVSSFAGSGLQTITLPEGLVELPERVFGNCEYLENVTLPESLTMISDRAFYYCAALTGLELPDSINAIDQAAFMGCRNLASLSMPANVAFIGHNAFDNCDALTVYVPGEGSVMDYMVENEIPCEIVSE